ncbi:DUF4232 domain-containing protein [Streptomyces sp. NPDC005648]|uniref:DUF4232 domain-containing protein n=1 Tax=Streptomyces sp. NPDC005648 TaxID=3157044 RepID=UPI0033A5AD86
MRAIPLTVAALAAALLLTGCDGGGGSSSSGSGGSSSSGDSKNGTACSLDRVALEVGPASVAPSVGDTGQVPVTVTNRGSKCTLDDFPGVRLARGGDDVSLPAEKGATAQKLTLAKDEAATFTITYQRGRKGDKLSLDADTLKVSLPPGDTKAQSFKWTYGSVAAKGDIGKVIASVSAFTQAGD